MDKRLFFEREAMVIMLRVLSVCSGYIQRLRCKETKGMMCWLANKIHDQIRESLELWRLEYQKHQQQYNDLIRKLWHNGA